MMPQHYIPEGAPNGTPVPLGPLFSGQNVTCEDGQHQPLHCTQTGVEETPMLVVAMHPHIMECL